jgi:hypothetical protein
MKLHERLLTILGDIKIFKWPCFIVYSPNGYRVKGWKVEDILDKIEPGDILLRGYDNYLDCKFIPGKFSHAAFYMGNRLVVHSLAEGVIKEHIFDFCKCDRIQVLRVKGINSNTLDIAISKAFGFIGGRYDFDFKKDNGKLYCSELVAKIWDHKIKMEPKKLKVLKLFNKVIILPDHFLEHPDIETIKL